MGFSDWWDAARRRLVCLLSILLSAALRLVLARFGLRQQPRLGPRVAAFKIA